MSNEDKIQLSYETRMSKIWLYMNIEHKTYIYVHPEDIYLYTRILNPFYLLLH